MHNCPGASQRVSVREAAAAGARGVRRRRARAARRPRHVPRPRAGERAARARLPPALRQGAYRAQGGGNLVLRHSVRHVCSNYRDIAVE